MAPRVGEQVRGAEARRQGQIRPPGEGHRGAAPRLPEPERATLELDGRAEARGGIGHRRCPAAALRWGRPGTVLKNVSPSSVVRSSPEGRPRRAARSRARACRRSGPGRTDAGVEASGAVHRVLRERQQHIARGRGDHGDAVVARVARPVRSSGEATEKLAVAPVKAGKRADAAGVRRHRDGSGAGRVAGGASQPSTSTPERAAGGRVHHDDPTSAVSAGSSVRVASTAHGRAGDARPDAHRRRPSPPSPRPRKSRSPRRSRAPLASSDREGAVMKGKLAPLKVKADERELTRATHDQHRRARAEGQAGDLQGRGRGRHAPSVQASPESDNPRGPGTRRARTAAPRRADPWGTGLPRDTRWRADSSPADRTPARRSPCRRGSAAAPGRSSASSRSREDSCQRRRPCSPCSRGTRRGTAGAGTPGSGPRWRWCSTGPRDSPRAWRSRRARTGSASQMRPGPPHVASLMHCRTHRPALADEEQVGHRGSTFGAQSAALAQAGRQAPCVTSQCWPAGQEASEVHRPRSSHRPWRHTWLAAQAASESHRHRPSEQLKPCAQSSAGVHSGRAAHTPPEQAWPAGQSASSRHIGPHPPKRQRPSGHSASVSQGVEEAGGHPESAANNRSASRALDIRRTGGKFLCSTRAMAAARWHG